MAQINHNTSTPNDDLGDQLRTAFGNQNTMNTELYDTKVDKVTGKGLTENEFTNALKDKLDGIDLDAQINVQADWEQEDDTADDYIKNKPTEYFTSVGSFLYADLATQTTPLSGVANVEKNLTNDIDGDETDLSNAPYAVNTLWDSATNKLDFLQLSIGDVVNLRTNLKVTTSTANQNIHVYARIGIGTSSEKEMLIGSKFVETAGEFTFDEELTIIFSKVDYIASVGELFLLSENDSTIKVQEFEFLVIKKNINLIEIDGITDLSTTRTPTNVQINSNTGTPALIGLGNGTNAGVSLNDYTTAEKDKLADTYITSEVDDFLDLKANLASPTFTGSVVVPSATLSTEAVNKGQLDAVSSVNKQYNTYFINTATGNNATGVFEDASKPFATIDYVNANFTLTQGAVIYLQGTGQTYAMNGQFQSVNQSIVADEGSTNILDFSSNTNTYAKNSGALALITVNMPNGVIRNERSGGTGIIFALGSGRNTNTNFNVKEIYWNCSTSMTQSTSLANKLQADKISSRVQLCQGISNDIIIQEFVCLATGANLSQYAKNVTINLISGSGSYNFSNSNEAVPVKYKIGDVTAIGGLIWSGYFGGIDITFDNSTITAFALASSSLLKTVRGNIKSITTISGSIHGTKFINFTADLVAGNMTLGASNATVSFENCSIKSTNSPIVITAGAFSNVLELKNSAFEVVNAVPLVTGGAGGTNTLKIAGISTNATTLSDQNGTGVTVSVIGKNSVADGVDSKDAVNKGQLDIISHWTKTVNDIANNNSGNVGIGTGATAPSSKLTVFGDVDFKTAGGVSKFFFNSNGQFTCGTALITPQLSAPGSETNIVFDSNNNYYSFDILVPSSFGTAKNIIGFTETFNLTSGSASCNLFSLNPTINQTGSSTSIIRSIYINPTLTSAVDFRAIEVTNGSVLLPYKAVTSTYTVLNNDYTIDATSGTFTITLPTAVGCKGRIYNIKNSGTGVITIDGNSSETIDGALTRSLVQWETLTIQSTNAGWIIL